jgi:hypothetical protein
MFCFRYINGPGEPLCELSRIGGSTLFERASKALSLVSESLSY